MADAIPPAPPPAAAPSAGGGAPVAVTVVSDAGAALKLMEGLLVEATANTRAARGAVEVTTADGVFQLKVQPGMSLPAFPAGAKLGLQMVGQPGSGGQLFLVAVNGRPLAGVTLAAMNAPQPGLMPWMPQSGGALAGLGQSGPTPAGALQQLQPGGHPGGAGGTPASGLLGTMPTATPAAAMPLGLGATLIRPAQVPGAPNTAPGQPQPAPGFAGLPPDLPAGSRLIVRIAGVQVPGAAAPSLDALPPGSISTAAATAHPGQPTPTAPAPAPGTAPAATPLLPATVIAHPPGGQAVVQTPIGTLAVPTHADLPAGTQLTLEVVGKPLPPLPAAATAAPQPGGMTAQGWPALTEALDVLANANQPQALEQLLRVLPQPDTRLAATMAAFTGALRGGDLKALLPDGSVRGLEKAGKKDIAARLKGDFEALASETGRPVGNGDWSVYPLPLVGGGVVEPVRLYVRRASAEESGGKAGNRGNDHRFVVDLNLSRLGRLQLDGLVRREDKLFDLIIRTGEPLDADSRRDILGIFTNASELVGTKGSVSFQAGGRWIDFPPAPPAPTRIEV